MILLDYINVRRDISLSNLLNHSTILNDTIKELCHVREIPVLMLPEEIVRQNLLKELLNYCAK